MSAVPEFPPMEQHLVVGYLKHWYLRRNGTSVHHRKPLEADSSKRLIRYAMLFNAYEYSVHIELFRYGEKIRLRGMLARAWSEGKKTTQMLRGVPDVLVVDPLAISTAFLDMTTLEQVQSVLGVQVVEAQEGASHIGVLVPLLEGAVSHAFARPAPLNDYENLAVASSMLTSKVCVDARGEMATPRYHDRTYPAAFQFHKRQPGRMLPVEWTRTALAELVPACDAWSDSEYRSFFVAPAGPHAHK